MANFCSAADRMLSSISDLRSKVYTAMSSQNIPPDRQALLRAFLERMAAASPTEAGSPGSPIDIPRQQGFEDGYLAALIDLLVRLGALTADPMATHVQSSSIQSGYFFRILGELLESPEPLVIDWSREGVTPRTDLQHPFKTGVDLLAALEQRRLELFPNAAPLREVQAAVGLIAARDQAAGRRYLFVNDRDAGAWQLPGGRFELNDGSLRGTLVRELTEELGCGELSAADVALAEIGPPFSIARVSPTYGLLTRTTFQVYSVRFTRGLPPVRAGARWLGADEVRAGATTDGQIVSAAPLRHILDQFGDALDALDTAQ